MTCPFCGSEMRSFALPKFNDDRMWTGLTKCSNPECKAAGPLISAPGEEEAVKQADAAARRRSAKEAIKRPDAAAQSQSEGPLMPMMLHMAMEAKYCFVELKSAAVDELRHSTIGRLTYSDDNTKALIWCIGSDVPTYAGLNFYGATWRCWPREPSPEEMTAIPWEVK